MSQDEQYLDMLVIFHYIVGALMAMFSCFPVIYSVFGIAMLSGAMDGKNPPPAVVAWIFILVPIIFILTGWAISALIIIAGSKLKRRVSWTFCVVVAAIECMFAPFGTVLGIFTLIVLMKDPVKASFTANQSQM
jgi:hypothetical protein